uniref:filamin-A-like isoform X3 n=1 Tax=Callithrix jacchus TaxID=9483 RepID=UPI00159D928D|nr:filamin-A-like isoform X3 [Callithrix jacchus]
MDNKDGSCSVEYIPYEPGTYSLNVTYGGHQVPGSPFMVPVHDVTEASKVKCSGPGLSPGMVRANLPQSFQVDTSKADVAPLQVKVQGPKGPRLVEPVDVVDNAHGTQTVNYLPSREGPYSISVLYGDEEVPQSPFKVKVLPSHDGSKVKASGPGLNTTGMPTSLPVEFTIDAKDAGEGLLAVQITVSSRHRQERQGVWAWVAGVWAAGGAGWCLVSLGHCTKEGREGQGHSLWLPKVVTNLGWW